MPILKTLYQRKFRISDDITVFVPTVGQVLNDEENYISILSVLTGHPSDFMVPLADAGIDFSEITDFDLLIKMFGGLIERDTSLIFGDLDLSQFVPLFDTSTNSPVLYNEATGATIDKATHAKIAATLRRIHHIDNKPIIPGNDEAKRYLIERTRKKMLRKKGKTERSEIESLIVSLVNTEQYKYNFETTLDLSILQFYECVYQIIKKDAYDKRMIGVYAGTVDTKEIKPEDLSWLA